MFGTTVTLIVSGTGTMANHPKSAMTRTALRSKFDTPRLRVAEATRRRRSTFPIASAPATFSITDVHHPVILAICFVNHGLSLDSLDLWVPRRLLQTAPFTTGRWGIGSLARG